MNLFFEELKLSIAQNGYVEMELNSLIANLVRNTNQTLSIRDVTTRRRTSISQRFYGESGFPDYMVLERSHTNEAAILGAIEIKAVNKKILPTDNQVIGHVNSFNKVIYTNGIEWIFLEKNQEPYILKICELKKGKITEIDDSKNNWDILKEKLQSFFNINKTVKDN